MKCILYLTFVLCSNIFVTSGRFLIQDAHISVPHMIKAAGYPAEKHRTTTADGYILQLYRIPGGRREKENFKTSTKAKEAVLVMHGIFGCSTNFLIMGPDRSLGYMLADAGYDVWLGNLRGNLHTAHLNLTRDNPKFWEYSFHEHGKYDVPALIDKVLAVTGLRRIMYIGHSMGTTSLLTTLALRPEYNDRVLAFVALAPAVYFDHMKSMAQVFIKTFSISDFLRSQGIMSASLKPELQDRLVANICSVKHSKDNICTLLLQVIVGEDLEQTDEDVTMQLMARIQPASWRQLEHFGKIALTSRFTSWEGGILGPVKPYNMSNIKVPVLLLYGENDQVAEKSQVMRLARELNTSGIVEDVRPGCSWPKFNHVDFLFAKDLGTLLNRPLLKRIRKLFNKYGLKISIA
ncbi:unnamed protein product [Parnassius apollo]|uniref:Lipase n=1 Tax=Parnassius apollo TaxID=110799 RepID=A0A8S3YAB5_PARAO|nr:unnamed protein product [Parnassius apollo]